MKILAKRSVPILLVSVFVCLALPAWGADKTKDEETIRNADTVLRAMVSGKDIPASTVAKADCIIILPSVKKFAVGIGGTGGRGPMTCREGANFNGKWGPPAMYSIGGASAGLQIGGTAKDFVILVMAPSAANKVLDGKVKVGSDATAAAGSGASASTSTADMLTYSRTSGVFAGVSLDGASLSPDSDANQRLYDKSVSAREIVSGGVKPTPAGEQLITLLNSRKM
ncbi:MAG: lipid-binding SYLF domain-containing protein [Candidatus Korobacteraceae bacterium]